MIFLKGWLAGRDALEGMEEGWWFGGGGLEMGAGRQGLVASLELDDAGVRGGG